MTDNLGYGTAKRKEGNRATLDGEIEEELGYLSPLEAVDVYLRFRQALDVLQTRNTPLFQAATTSLSVDEQTYLMEIMREAESHATTASA